LQAIPDVLDRAGARRRQMISLRHTRDAVNMVHLSGGAFVFGTQPQDRTPRSQNPYLDGDLFDFTGRDHMHRCC